MREKIIKIVCCCLFLGNGCAFSQNWSALNNGVNYLVHSFFSDSTNNRLYIGGQFALADGLPAPGVCYWDGSNFHSMGCGVDWDCSTPLNNNSTGTVADIITYENNIYICGGFSRADNKPIKYIARWSNGTWDSVSNCPNNAIADFIVSSNNELIVVGDFSQIGGVFCNGVAKWNGSIWSSFGTDIPFNYGDYLINTVCEYNGEIYVGGNFSNNQYNELIKWNGNDWVNPGINFWGGFASVNTSIVYNNELYIGGMFTSDDGNLSNYITKFNGVTWTDVGGGLSGIYGQVYQFTIHNNELYAVGAFQAAGGVPAKFLAKWDGTNWCGFGTDFNNTNLAIGSYNNELYLGCGSKTIEGDTVNYLAKWIGGNYVDACGNATEIKEIEANTSELTIYPNPANNQIKIDFKSISKDVLIEIKNVLGETVFSEKLRSLTSKTIDISEYPNGIYFLCLQSNADFSIEKFVKQ